MQYQLLGIELKSKFLTLSNSNVLESIHLYANLQNISSWISRVIKGQMMHHWQTGHCSIVQVLKGQKQHKSGCFIPIRNLKREIEIGNKSSEIK